MIHFQLTVHQIAKLDEIAQKYTEALTVLNQYSEEKKAFILTQSLISNIGASTRIENAVLTDVEIEWVHTTISTEARGEYRNREVYIKNKLSKDKERSLEEVAGYRKAIQLVFTDAKGFCPLRESDVKGLHREMLQYFSDAAYHFGDYKTQSNSVYETHHQLNTRKIVLKTADPGMITVTSMRDLLDWFNETAIDTPLPIPVAVEFIFRFLAIHPFQDGNGRLSRLLFQLILLNSGKDYMEKVFPYIGFDRAIEQNRAKYYRVLQKCSNGEYHPDPTAYRYSYFLEFMQDMLILALKNLTHYAQKYDRYLSLSDTAITVLNCFKLEPEQNLTTKVIMEKLHFPRRTIIYSLNQLVQDEFLNKIGKGASVRYRMVF